MQRRKTDKNPALVVNDIVLGCVHANSKCFVVFTLQLWMNFIRKLTSQTFDFSFLHSSRHYTQT